MVADEQTESVSIWSSALISLPDFNLHGKWHTVRPALHGKWHAVRPALHGKWHTVRPALNRTCI